MTPILIDPFPANPDEEWAHISFGEGWSAGVYVGSMQESYVTGFSVLFSEGNYESEWAVIVPVDEKDGGARVALTYAMDVAAWHDFIELGDDRSAWGAP